MQARRIHQQVSNITPTSSTALSPVTRSAELKPSFRQRGLLNVTNSTITGNTGGPTLAFQDHLECTNGTIGQNECGIKRTLPTTTAPDRQEQHHRCEHCGLRCSRTFTSGGFNLIGNVGLSTGFTNGANNDQVGTSSSPLEPGSTQPVCKIWRADQTIALQPDSPAIDKGTAAD